MDDPTQFDPRLYDLLPHRPPMLLINRLIAVNEQQSHTKVYIHPHSPFYTPNQGVPAWIGLEYMGQTAALIAGYQVESGMIGSHLGFLLGTRNYQIHCPYFAKGLSLDIICKEKAIIGDDLATFDCSIQANDNCLAHATLSVFRKPITIT